MFWFSSVDEEDAAATEAQRTPGVRTQPEAVSEGYWFSDDDEDQVGQKTVEAKRGQASASAEVKEPTKENVERAKRLQEISRVLAVAQSIRERCRRNSESASTSKDGVAGSADANDSSSGIQASRQPVTQNIKKTTSDVNASCANAFESLGSVQRSRTLSPSGNFEERPILYGRPYPNPNMANSDCVVGYVEEKTKRLSVENSEDYAEVRRILEWDTRTKDEARPTRSEVDAATDLLCKLRSENLRALEARQVQRSIFSPHSLRMICLRCIRNDDRLHEEVLAFLQGDENVRNFSKLSFTSKMIIKEHEKQYLALQKAYRIPYTINRYLFDYQRKGAEFMFDVMCGLMNGGAKERGGVLADEMGLGKTIQVIAFLAALFGKSGTSHDQDVFFRRRRKGSRDHAVLIVTPANVVNQWIEQIHHWGYFEVVKYEKGNPKYHGAFQKIAEGSAEIAICSYDQLCTVFDFKDSYFVADTGFLKCEWQVVIFDEAHYVKNTKSKRSKCCKAIPCDCKIGLTGTPLSNNLEELWGMMNVLTPSTFGPSKAFKNTYRPIIDGRTVGCDVHLIRACRAATNRLHEELSLVMLRRQKKIIADQLTIKQDKMVLCPLSRQQEQAYLNALRSPDYLVVTAAIAAKIRRDQLSHEYSDIQHYDDDGEDRDFIGPIEDFLRNLCPLGYTLRQLSECPLWRQQHRYLFTPEDDAEDDVEYMEETESAFETREAQLESVATRRKRRKVVKVEGSNSKGSDATVERALAETFLDDIKDMNADCSEDGELPAPFWSHEHSSSEEETDDEHDIRIDDQGRRMRAFRVCRKCSGSTHGKENLPYSARCLILPLVTDLVKIANHLDIVRVERIPGNSTRKHRRMFRKHMRRAKIYLAGNPDKAFKEGLRGDVIPNDVDPYLRSDREICLQDESQCGKLGVLRQLLEMWGKQVGTKVLVFSNSLVLLDVLSGFLRGLGIMFSRLDGKTSIRERDALCGEFNTCENFHVFLVSTRAGGVGLNLQGANKVVIFDPDFDPACDLQAQARAHRIGQTRNVECYRLISLGTIEELKYLRQIYKTHINNTVLDKSTEKRLFAFDELKGMKSILRYSRNSFTKRVVDQYNQKRRLFRGGNGNPSFEIVDWSGSEEPDNDYIEDADVVVSKEMIRWETLAGNDEQELEYEESMLAAAGNEN